MNKFLTPLVLIACLLFCSFNATVALAKKNKPNSTPRLHVHIRGIKGKLLENSKANLKKKAKQIQYSLNHKNIRRLYRSSNAIIRLSIEPYGYFHVKIKKKLTHQGKNWTITYQITPGAVTKVTRVNLNITGAGAYTKPFLRLQKQFPVKVGQNFNSDRYDQAKTLLFSRAVSLGYFSAHMKKAEIIIDKQLNTARITLSFYTGNRHAFGSTTFSKTPYDTAFLRRFLSYKKGEHFRQNKLNSTQKAFQSTPYFQQVTVKPLLNQLNKKQLPIAIHLIPQNSRIYTIGAGYGTDIGPRGVAGVQFLRATKTGHRFDMKISGSPRYSYFLSHYIIPGKHPATDQYTIGLGLSHEDFDAGKSKSVNLSFNYHTVVHGWQQTLGLTYLIEKYSIKNEAINPSLSNTNANVLYPHILWIKVKANDPIHIKKGYKLAVNLSAASRHIASKTNFFQGVLSDKFIYTLGSRTRVIAHNSFGYTKIKHLINLPLSLQFLAGGAGGANSIRGYSYNSIGPGRYLTINSLELQEKIYGDFYAAAFCDTGNVAEKFPEKQKIGVGGGIAWLSPIGAVEITLAQAISEKKKPWTVQFNMGPEL